MPKTTYHIPGMDCPTEERMIRLKLEGLPGLGQLQFDLEKRKLEAFHPAGMQSEILQNLASLNMGAMQGETVAEEFIGPGANPENRALWIVLMVNVVFFLVEMVAGLFSGSMGLVADSLDMLADSFVYALALVAVGGAMILKKRVAKISGYLQLLLAAIGFAEIIRRFLGTGDIPGYQTMMVVSALALVANLFCLLILQRLKNREAHLQASILFTSNDIIINAGVIVAGALVWSLHSQIPDLIVGSVVFVIVLRGAVRILKLS
jgi:Co/Zn/Cd efflux system component